MRFKGQPMMPLPMDLRNILRFGEIMTVRSQFGLVYFRKSFYFLAMICICRNQLRSAVWDLKRLIHIQYNNSLSRNLLSYRRLRYFLFSVSSFKLIKDVSHLSDLICWQVFILPSKSELQLPGASLLLRSDLFNSCRICLGFDLWHIAVFSSRFIHNSSIFARFIGFPVFFCFYQIYLP